jgi:hypothetical protein
VLLMAGELALGVNGSWQARGKWAPRQLRATDVDLANDLMSVHRIAVATGHISNLVEECEAVLNKAGGRLTEGFSAR